MNRCLSLLSIVAVSYAFYICILAAVLFGILTGVGQNRQSCIAAVLLLIRAAAWPVTKLLATMGGIRCAFAVQGTHLPAYRFRLNKQSHVRT